MGMAKKLINDYEYRVLREEANKYCHKVRKEMDDIVSCELCNSQFNKSDIDLHHPVEIAVGGDPYTVQKLCKCCHYMQHGLVYNPIKFKFNSIDEFNDMLLMYKTQKGIADELGLRSSHIAEAYAELRTGMKLTQYRARLFAENGLSKSGNKLTEE